MSNIRRKLITVMLISTMIGGIYGCKKKETPAEDAGRKVDQAIEKTGQSMDKAGQKIEETGKDMKDAVKDKK